LLRHTYTTGMDIAFQRRPENRCCR